MRLQRVLASLSMCYLLIGQAAFGWWADEHRIIASIAQQRLNSKANAAIRGILAEGQTLVSIAPWADEVRGERKETSAWHYIDVPTEVSRRDWAQYCSERGCIPKAIRIMQARLKDPALSRQQHSEALCFLVHFIGDLHEPLHVGDRGDRGGNERKVRFRGQTMSLHSAWDGKLPEAWFKLEPSARQELLRGAPLEDRVRIQAGTLEDWLWETQAAAREAAYGPLDRCRCSVLDKAYLAQAIPVLKQQLLRAGERLGKILNDTLGR